MDALKMKQAVYTEYGSPEVMKIRDVAIPTPRPNEILVRIHASTVTATEATFRKGESMMTRLFTGFSKPKINTLGEELAGEVIAIGSEVSAFHPGDQVFGTAGPEFGANAEYLCLPEKDAVLTKMPQNLSYEEAASAVDGFLTAMPFLRDKGLIGPGQKVLIIGASGSIGSSAVQIARHFGAKVNGVCSTANIDLVKSLGAEEVIDYKKEDFAERGERYDIIFDAVGKRSFSDCKKALKPEGIFLAAAIGFGVMPHVIWTSLFGKKKARIHATGLRPPQERMKDLELLKELLEKEVIQPVIDRRYPFDEIAAAHRYVDTGRKKGNVVLHFAS